MKPRPKSPYHQGAQGILCLPMYRNVTKPAHKDWKLIFCPNCGALCWMSEQAKKMLEIDTQLRAMCTACALRKGGIT